MIPKRYIEEWREFAPWSENGQVEQDLKPFCVVF